jgi:hypothetical protein
VVEVKVLLFHTDLEWRLHCLVDQGLPIEIGEPRMAFYFIDPHHSHSFSRLAYETFVDEIGCLSRIVFRQIIIFNCCLFGQDSFSNFLSLVVFACIRSFPKNTFITYHPHGKIISCHPMTLFEHYLRCHVARSTTILSVVFRSPFSCNAKIS